MSVTYVLWCSNIGLFCHFQNADLELSSAQYLFFSLIFGICYAKFGDSKQTTLLYTICPSCKIYTHNSFAVCAILLALVTQLHTVHGVTLTLKVLVTTTDAL